MQLCHRILPKDWNSEEASVLCESKLCCFLFYMLFKIQVDVFNELESVTKMSRITLSRIHDMLYSLHVSDTLFYSFQQVPPAENRSRQRYAVRWKPLLGMYQ